MILACMIAGLVWSVVGSLAWRLIELQPRVRKRR